MSEEQHYAKAIEKVLSELPRILKYGGKDGQDFLVHSLERLPKGYLVRLIYKSKDGQEAINVSIDDNLDVEGWN